MGWDWLKEMSEVVMRSNDSRSGVRIEKFVKWMVFRHVGLSKDAVWVHGYPRWAR